MLQIVLVLTLISKSLSLCSTTSISNIQVHKVPLRRNDQSSPYCYAVSSITGLQPQQNFLATQVWPAARAAAAFLESHLPSRDLVVCELGCGPGLPSLTAATLVSTHVIATDLDTLALDLVEGAARDQKLNVRVERVDLCGDSLPEADLYVLSDVFESGSVAEGTARLLHAKASDKVVWVFCQSDRAQREIFSEALRNLRGDDLDWIPLEEYDPSKRLCLFNIEEAGVSYG